VKEAMPQRARVLVVDDEPSVTGMLRIVLESAGHEVVATERSDEAATWLAEPDHHFDLMISDIRMKPLDGIELLRRARRLRPSLPVILVTAYESDETRAEASRLGARAYVTKPFAVDDLLEAVARELERGAAQSGPKAGSHGG